MEVFNKMLFDKKKGKKKKGAIGTDSIRTAIIAIVMLVVMFKLYASLVPEAMGAGDELTDTARCSAVGCFWNDTRTIDCTQHNYTIGDDGTCANYQIPLGGLFSGSGV